MKAGYIVKYMLLLAVVSLLAIFSYVVEAHAQTPYIVDDFDSYSTGALNGNGNWSEDGSDTANISTSVFFSSPNGLQLNGFDTNNAVYTEVGTSDQTQIRFKLYISDIDDLSGSGNNDTAMRFQVLYDHNGMGNNDTAYLALCSTSATTYSFYATNDGTTPGNNNCTMGVGSITQDQWVDIKWTFDWDNLEHTILIDDTDTMTSTLDASTNSTANFESLTMASTWDNELEWYVDDFGYTLTSYDEPTIIFNDDQTNLATTTASLDIDYYLPTDWGPRVLDGVLYWKLENVEKDITFEGTKTGSSFVLDELTNKIETVANLPNTANNQAFAFLPEGYYILTVGFVGNVEYWGWDNPICDPFGLLGPFCSDVQEANDNVLYQFAETGEFSVGYSAMVDFEEGWRSPALFNDVDVCEGVSGIELVTCRAVDFINSSIRALFIPDRVKVTTTLENIRTDLLTRMPWGYATRTYEILTATSTATTTLPSFTATLRLGPGSDETPEESTLTFDMADMFSGGASLLASVEDPIYGQTAEDVFGPFVDLGVALAVIMTILADVMQSHRHHTDTSEKRKLS